MELPQTFQDWEEFFARFDGEMADSQTYDKDKIGLMQFAAGELIRNNDYQGAKNFLQRALSLAKKIEDRISQAEILNALAQIFYNEQKLEDAILYAQQALNIYKQEKGDASPEVIDMYNNMAIIQEAAGNYDEAITLMMENIKRVKESDKFDDLYLATSYNNLAGIFWSRNQPNSALEYLLKAKEIKEKHLNEDDPQLAEVYNNLALINLSLENIQQAEHYQRRALELIEKNNPDSHEMVTGLRNMALIYERQDKLIEALDYLDRAIKILKKIFPYGHPEIDEAEQIRQQWEQRL
jgi:tetratricopeptide (TPR) repeat protein